MSIQGVIKFPVLTWQSEQSPPSSEHTYLPNAYTLMRVSPCKLLTIIPEFSYLDEKHYMIDLRWRNSLALFHQIKGHYPI